MGFQGILHFFLIYILSMHSKRELSFDRCRFLLFGGPLNVIGVLRFEVYNKRPSSRKSHYVLQIKSNFDEIKAIKMELIF